MLRLLDTSWRMCIVHVYNLLDYCRILMLCRRNEKPLGIPRASPGAILVRDLGPLGVVLVAPFGQYWGVAPCQAPSRWTFIIAIDSLTLRIFLRHGIELSL